MEVASWLRLEQHETSFFTAFVIRGSPSHHLHACCDLNAVEAIR